MSNTLKVSRVVSMYRRVVLAEVMSLNSWSYPYRKLTYPTGSLTTLTGSLIVNGVELSRLDMSQHNLFLQKVDSANDTKWKRGEGSEMSLSRDDSAHIDTTRSFKKSTRLMIPRDRMREGSEMSSSRHDSTRVDTTRSFKTSTRLMIPRDRMEGRALKCRRVVTTWHESTRLFLQEVDSTNDMF